VSHLTRRADNVGIVYDDLPWVAMPCKRRIGLLKSRLQRAEAVLNSGDGETYEALAKDLYGMVRETWERAVEEVLLNRVVLRFGNEVQTRRLDRLTDITDADVEVVRQGMTKSSRFLRGHDEPAAVSGDVPDPDEVRSDIADLETWVKELRKRGRS